MGGRLREVRLYQISLAYKEISEFSFPLTPSRRFIIIATWGDSHHDS